jgi:hypothetical protein
MSGIYTLAADTSVLDALNSSMTDISSKHMYIPQMYGSDLGFVFSGSFLLSVGLRDEPIGLPSSVSFIKSRSDCGALAWRGGCIVVVSCIFGGDVGGL